MKQKRAIRFFLDNSLHEKFKNYVSHNCCDFSKVLRRLITNLLENDHEQNLLI